MKASGSTASWAPDRAASSMAPTALSSVAARSRNTGGCWTSAMRGMVHLASREAPSIGNGAAARYPSEQLDAVELRGARAANDGHEVLHVGPFLQGPRGNGVQLAPQAVGADPLGDHLAVVDVALDAPVGKRRDAAPARHELKDRDRELGGAAFE